MAIDRWLPDSTQTKKISKAAISIILLLYLAYTIPLNETISEIQNLERIYLIPISVGILGEVFLSSYSLYLLCAYYGVVSYRRVFNIGVLDYLANSFIPSRIGALATTPVLFDRYSPLSKSDGFQLRITHFQLVALVTVLVGMIGFSSIFDKVQYEILSAILVSVLAYLGIALGFSVMPVFAGWRWLWEILPAVSGGVKDWDAPPWRERLFPAAVLLISMVLFGGIRFGGVAAAVGAEIPLWQVFVLPIMMYSVTILPVSISGIGVTELTGSAVLVALGIPPETAAAAVVIDRFAVSYLPLLVYYLYGSYLLKSDSFQPT